MTSARRNDFDVTNTVQVSSTNAVHAAVDALVRPTWPDAPHGELASAFEHFEEVFAGRFPGYFGVDTVYHDRQHTLDITLALARMLVGYERQVEPELRMGGERAVVGLDRRAVPRCRISPPRGRGRSLAQRRGVHAHARVARRPLPRTNTCRTRRSRTWTEKACEIVHFTGYEVPLAKINVSDPRDIKLGHMIGTADMIAQMSDRCYLEKCRDRLYAEFVLGGVALPVANNGGERQVKYASGLDLLRQTPEFVSEVRTKRLDGEFGAAYRYLEILFGGENPYVEAIDRNVEFLRQVLRSENWRLLRRNPPIFAALPDPMTTMRGLMLGYIKKAWSNR